MMLEKNFLDFMHRHYQGEKPVLLALSGGPDSLALFYLLLKYGFPFGVAHVDHGWRSESGQEAAILKKLALENHLPFHERKLNGVVSELICREERIKFFTELHNEHGYHALILGHQKDDQVETVFKRILEGASLVNLAGMAEVGFLNGIPVWRPLLQIEKREILQWNQDHNLQPFIDSSNENTKFLRNRMRREMIPDLNLSFGKDIQPSLHHLGEEAKELQSFLNKHLAPILQKFELSSSGYFLDLAPFDSISPFETKYLVRLFCKEYFTPSRDFVDTTFDLVARGVANKVLISGRNHLYIDRKRLFLSKEALEPVPVAPQPLVDGTIFGSWRVSIEDASNTPFTPTDWKGAWNGEMKVVLPKGDYMLGPSKTQEISKRWNNHKVPSFLGDHIPAIWKDGVLVHEFLTGKPIISLIVNHLYVRMTNKSGEHYESYF